MTTGPPETMSTLEGAVGLTIRRVTVRGRFTDVGYVPKANAAVQFRPRVTRLVDRNENVIMLRDAYVARTDQTGAFMASLAASNDPDITPSGWTYEVIEPGGARYDITVPIDAPEIDGLRIIDLGNIVPTEAFPGVVQLLAGPPGPAGPQGERGEVGTGFRLNGTVQTQAHLPAGASAGDAYMVIDQDHTIFVWSGDGWANVGKLSGPAGPQGSAGPAGAASVIPGPRGEPGAGAVTGAISAFGGAGAPEGYLLCDGTDYATTTHPALFAVIGTTYGGTGGRFRVPDLRGRFPIGAGFSEPFGAPAEIDRPRGTTGGERMHTLASAAMPAHNHGGATTGATQRHTHGAGGGAFGFVIQTMGSSLGLAVPGNSSATYTGWTANDREDHAHYIFQEGAGEPHNNMPPFLAINYIIKT